MESGDFSIEGTDHPRTRGDKTGVSHLTDNRAGSPPHTRGQEIGAVYPRQHCRITPAHAGTSGKN